MSKRRKQTSEGPEHPGDRQTDERNEAQGGRRNGTTRGDNGSQMEDTLTAYAQTLGTAMGNIRNSVDSWKGQRKHLVDQLSNLVTDAQTLLTDLGHTATQQVEKIRRRGRPRKTPAAIPVVAQKPGLHAKRKMLSEAGRAAISAAQKKRWAVIRKAQK